MMYQAVKNTRGVEKMAFKAGSEKIKLTVVTQRYKTDMIAPIRFFPLIDTNRARAKGNSRTINRKSIASNPVCCEKIFIFLPCS